MAMKRATTSASNLFRRKLCPGSARLEEGLAEEESEFSEEGTMLHKLFLTGERPDTLTIEQKEALDTADAHAREFFRELREHFDISEDEPFEDERDVPLGNEWLTGHADYIRTWPLRGVCAIADAKMGFMEVDAAADNLQLVAYAVLRGADYTGVCIVQPRNFGPRSTKALYKPNSINDAARQIREIVANSRTPDAPLIAGQKQCHYCKAKPICPAYKEKFLALERHDLPLAIETVSNEQLEQLHTAIAFAQKIARSVNDEMRERIEAGQLPGWKLQNAGDITECTDPLGLMNKLIEEVPGLTAKQFDDCRKVEWGKLEYIVGELLKLSERKVKDVIRPLATPFVTRTPKAKRIVREKNASPAVIE